MFNPYIILGILLALISSGVGGYTFGYDVAEKAYIANVMSLQADAHHRLAEKTKEVLAATEKQIQTNQQLEIAHHEANQKIDAALAANRTLKLRVAAAAPRCDSVPKDRPSNNAPDPPQSVELELPRSITDDLFGLAASADRVANYADSCYRWVKTLR
jgi:hypothetical protein